MWLILVFLNVKVDSFIPLYEWDLPKKKVSKKKLRAQKEAEKAAAGGEGNANGGATIEEVDDSGVDSSRPVSRQAARIEEIPDDGKE